MYIPTRGKHKKVRNRCKRYNAKRFAKNRKRRARLKK